MNTAIIRGVSVFTEKPVEISLIDGKIAGVRPIDPIPGLPYIAPGFLDIQINGYSGIDYAGNDLNPEGINSLCIGLAETGTTRHFPTIITNPYERIIKNLGIISMARRTDKFVRESVPGIHIEGPFISPSDGPRGAHERAFVRKPDFEEFLRWQEASEGLIKLVTLAPESEGALEFIEKITARGTIAAIGHTGADPKKIREAVSAGAKLSTHLGNGSHAELPRLVNYLWEQLAADGLAASVICDGFHLPPAVMKVFRRAKGPERLILVSDAVHLAGMKPGVYKLGNTDVELHEDGHIEKVDSPYLAGAGFLLDRCIPQYVRHAGGTLTEALRACTVTPARLFGLRENDYSLEPEGAANFAVFDLEPGDDKLKVRFSLVGNETYTQKSEKEKKP
jgi:N-acetylglucosamine-6-phosphate deacetylase